MGVVRWLSVRFLSLIFIYSFNIRCFIAVLTSSRLTAKIYAFKIWMKFKDGWLGLPFVHGNLLLSLPCPSFISEAVGVVFALRHPYLHCSALNLLYFKTTESTFNQKIDKGPKVSSKAEFWFCRKWEEHCRGDGRRNRTTKEAHQVGILCQKSKVSGKF